MALTDRLPSANMITPDEARRLMVQDIDGLLGEAYTKIRAAAMKGEEEVTLYGGEWVNATPRAKAARLRLQTEGWGVYYRGATDQRDTGSTTISWKDTSYIGGKD